MIHEFALSLHAAASPGALEYGAFRDAQVLLRLTDLSLLTSILLHYLHFPVNQSQVHRQASEWSRNRDGRFFSPENPFQSILCDHVYSPCRAQFFPQVLPCQFFFQAMDDFRAFRKKQEPD